MSGLVGYGAVHTVLSGRPFGGRTPPIPYIYFITDICRYKSGVLVQIGFALQYTFRKIELAADVLRRHAFGTLKTQSKVVAQ